VDPAEALWPGTPTEDHLRPASALRYRLLRVESGSQVRNHNRESHRHHVIYDSSRAGPWTDVAEGGTEARRGEQPRTSAPIGAVAKPTRPSPDGRTRASDPIDGSSIKNAKRLTTSRAKVLTR